MKAITVSQPYASLIADGEKWVENRQRWPNFYRGPILIHAGKGTQYLDREDLVAYPTGCVVAVANLFAVVNVSAVVNLLTLMPLASMRLIAPTNPVQRGPLTVGQILAHKYTEGPICLILTQIRKLASPVPCRGMQGLWEAPEVVLRTIQDQIATDFPSPAVTSGGSARVSAKTAEALVAFRGGRPKPRRSTAGKGAS